MKIRGMLDYFDKALNKTPDLVGWGQGYQNNRSIQNILIIFAGLF